MITVPTEHLPAQSMVLTRGFSSFIFKEFIKYIQSWLSSHFLYTSSKNLSFHIICPPAVEQLSLQTPYLSDAHSEARWHPQALWKALSSSVIMDHQAHLFWQVSITASDGQLCHLVGSLFSPTLIACQVSTEILMVKLKPFVWGCASSCWVQDSTSVWQFDCNVSVIHFESNMICDFESSHTWIF